jgi:hypothetical protein
VTIEQRSELNRFVDPSIPLTWEGRWRQIQMTLPLWVFSFVCFFEMVLFRGWLAENLSLDFLLTCMGGFLFLLFICFGGIETQVRIRQRSKRVIQFKENKIVVRPARIQSVPWKGVAKIQFEPIPEAPGMTKLKLFLPDRSNKRVSGRVFWAMILENCQRQDLLRYLQTKKTDALIRYQIEVLERPSTPESPARFPFLGMSLYTGGIYLLLHGGPMFLASLNSVHHDSGGNSKLTPEEAAKLQRFIARHFSSYAEFHHFFLTLGIGLTIAGLVLLITGWRLMKRKRTATQP